MIQSKRVFPKNILDTVIKALSLNTSHCEILQHFCLCYCRSIAPKKFILYVNFKVDVFFPLFQKKKVERHLCSGDAVLHQRLPMPYVFPLLALALDPDVSRRFGVRSSHIYARLSV